MNEVRVATADGVAGVTLVAPGRRNALTPAIATELISALAKIDDDQRVDAVVLAGEFGCFCVRADRATLDTVAEDPAAGPPTMTSAGSRAVGPPPMSWDAAIKVGHAPQLWSSCCRVAI